MFIIKIHPITVIIYTVINFLMLVLYNHPIYILGILLSTIIQFLMIKERRALVKTLKVGLYMVMIIFVINPLVSGTTGSTILFSSSRIPLIGKILISLEALFYGLNMGVKLMGIFLVFTLYGLLVEKDDGFSFFSKYANRTVLTFSLSVNAFHRIRLDMARAKDTMVLRGVLFNSKNPMLRLKAYSPLLKVVLISTLEGSLNRAEAMYSRQYGMNKRTCYAIIHFKIVDIIFNALNAALLILLVYGLLINAGQYNFYPSLDAYEYKDFCFVSAIVGIQILTSILILGSKKWRFLEYRI